MRKKSASRTLVIKLLIIVVIGILLKLFVPLAYDLTPDGVTYLAIFIGAVLCWIFVGSVWPSILAMALLVMTGVLTIGEVGAGSMGNMLVLALIYATIIAAKLREYGVLRYLARWAISRKIVHGRPYVFGAIWCLANFIVVAVSGHIFAYLLFIPLMKEVCEEIGAKRGDGFYLMLILLTLWSGIIAEGIFPFTSMTTLTGIGMLTSLGYPLNSFVYLKASLVPGLVIIIPLALLVCRFVLKPDMAYFTRYDDAAARKQLKEEKVSLQGKITMTVLIVWMIFSAIIPGLTVLGVFSTWASSVTLAGFMLFAISLLCIIHIDGEPIVNLEVDYTKVPWGAVIFTSAIMLFSNTISNEEFGIISTLSQILYPVTQHLSIPLVIIIAAVFVTVVSNFMSNTVTCVIGLTTFIPMLTEMGATAAQINSAGILIILMCSVAFLTPSASPGTPIIMGREASMTEMFKCGFIYIALMLVVLIPIFSMIMPQIM